MFSIRLLQQLFNTIYWLSKPKLSGSLQEGINSLPLLAGKVAIQDWDSICNAWEYQGSKYCLQLLGWQALAFQQFQQVFTLRTNSQHKIHMILEAKFITKKTPRSLATCSWTIPSSAQGISNMWSMENQLLCLSHINAHFILLGPVTNNE